MPISTTDSAVSYVANGGTDYVVQFPFINAEDLSVNLQIGVPLVPQILGTHYNVSDQTVIFATAPEAGSRIVITRQTKLTQLEKFEDGGRLPAATINGALDKLTLICQELKTRLNQTISVGDFTNITPEGFLEQLSLLSLEAQNTLEAAQVAAAVTSLVALGKLDYIVPAAVSADMHLTLKVEFSPTIDFNNVIAVDSNANQANFLVFEDGAFVAAPEHFTLADAGKMVVLLPAGVSGIDAAQIYYVRSKWTDGVTDTVWTGAVYAVPSGVSTDPGGEATSVLPLSALPDTITGLAIYPADGTISVTPGHAADATRTYLMRSNAVLTLPAIAILRNTEYSVYLVSKLDGTPAVFATAGVFQYTNAWTNPKMFANNYPVGYTVAASSVYNSSTGAYRAFDKINGAANLWISGNSASYEHRIQMVFDRPKKLSSVKLVNSAAAPHAKDILIYVLTAESGDPANVNATAGWTQDGAARVGSSVVNGETTFEIAYTGEAYGVRLVITSTFTGTQNVRVGEIVVSGFERTRDESVPLTLPVGYSYYREIGRFMIGNTGLIDTASIRSLVPQRMAEYQGRVWVSPPIFPTANTLITLAHGLTLSPDQVRVEIFAKCVAEQDTAKVGDIALSLAETTNFRAIQGVVDKTNVKFYIPAGLAFYREFPRANTAGATISSGGSVAMSFDCWVLFAKIYY